MPKVAVQFLSETGEMSTLLVFDWIAAKLCPGNLVTDDFVLDAVKSVQATAEKAAMKLVKEKEC